MGKSSINGPLSMAMLNNQMVYIYIMTYWYHHFHSFFPWNGHFIGQTRHALWVPVICVRSNLWPPQLGYRFDEHEHMHTKRVRLETNGSKQWFWDIPSFVTFPQNRVPRKPIVDHHRRFLAISVYFGFTRFLDHADFQLPQVTTDLLTEARSRIQPSVGQQEIGVLIDPCCLVYDGCLAPFFCDCIIAVKTSDMFWWMGSQHRWCGLWLCGNPSAISH